jgi:hypothetical protein
MIAKETNEFYTNVFNDPLLSTDRGAIVKSMLSKIYVWHGGFDSDLFYGSGKMRAHRIRSCAPSLEEKS